MCYIFNFRLLFLLLLNTYKQNNNKNLTRFLKVSPFRRTVLLRCFTLLLVKGIATKHSEIRTLKIKIIGACHHSAGIQSRPFN